MFQSLAGKLLVASPDLFDPNFARAVVLVLEHTPEDGALGVVLSRPSDEDVAPYLPDWSSFTSDPTVVFVGGPVTPEVALGVVDTPGTTPDDWNPVVGNVGLVDLSNDPETVGGVLRVRVFAGYSGWIAGQLEDELRIDSWFVVDAEVQDVFSEEPIDLWRTVLRRQPGRLSWYANFPPHPRMN